MSALKKDNKLRILHVIAGMNRGGAETFVMNVFRTIDRNKFQFYFFTVFYKVPTSAWLPFSASHRLSLCQLPRLPAA